MTMSMINATINNPPRFIATRKCLDLVDEDEDFNGFHLKLKDDDSADPVCDCSGMEDKQHMGHYNIFYLACAARGGK
jgi:hypothetical protein